jgi:hypothetical protein
MISTSQTTFIEKPCIHYNFVYVQEVIRELHKNKISAMFIKLDIPKAFDTINWPYM